MELVRNVLSTYLYNASYNYPESYPLRLLTSFGHVYMDVRQYVCKVGKNEYIKYSLVNIENYSLNQLWEIFLIVRAHKLNNAYTDINDSARAVELAFKHVGYPRNNTNGDAAQLAILIDERDKARRELEELQDKLKKIISI